MNNRKLKILMIAPTPFFADRGCHIRIYEEIKALEKINHSVFLCAYHLGKDKAGLKIYRIVNIPWYKKLEAGPSCHKFYLDILLFFKSLKIAFKIKPDIIHGHLHEGAIIGFAISKIIRKPLLFDLQGSLTGEMKAHNFIKLNSLSFYFFYKVEKIINNLANIIIAPSNEIIEKTIDKFKIKKEKILLVTDGVNSDEFKPDYSVNNLRKKLNLPLNKKIVVYLGLLTKYQGVDCLINAIPYVLKKTKNVHFLIMGYPNELFYKRMVKKLGISSEVTFMGRIDYKKAPYYLCLGDIAVAPKIAETEADGKIYNYMAAGLPVIASDRLVSKQILGDAAIYTKRGNSVSLAEGIIKLLKDEYLAKNLGKKNREKAVKNYSWDNSGKKLEKIYFKILKNES